jgi:hypothetical protein
MNHSDPITHIEQACTVRTLCALDNFTWV